MNVSIDPRFIRPQDLGAGRAQDDDKWCPAERYLMAKFNCQMAFDSHLRHQMYNMSNAVKGAAEFYSRPENALLNLVMEAASGNGAAQLDYATHLLVGFRCDADEVKAETLFRELAGDASQTPELRARAFSQLIDVVEPRLAAEPVDPKGGGIDERLFLAVQAATLGLYSPAVLHQASCFRYLRDSEVGQDPSIGRTLAPLWRAADANARDTEQRHAADHKQKVEKHPQKYRCANPECTIECLRRGPLLKCAGKCDADVKPYYCEKSCQKAHWKAHKPFCKPGTDRHSEPVERPALPRLAPSAEEHDHSDCQGCCRGEFFLATGNGPYDPNNLSQTRKIQVTQPDTGEKLTITSNGSLEELKSYARKLEGASRKDKPAKSKGTRRRGGGAAQPGQNAES